MDYAAAADAQARAETNAAHVSHADAYEDTKWQEAYEAAVQKHLDMEEMKREMERMEAEKQQFLVDQKAYYKELAENQTAALEQASIDQKEQYEALEKIMYPWMFTSAPNGTDTTTTAGPASTAAPTTTPMPTTTTTTTEIDVQETGASAAAKVLQSMGLGLVAAPRSRARAVPTASPPALARVALAGPRVEHGAAPSRAPRLALLAAPSPRLRRLVAPKVRAGRGLVALLGRL